ncbi:Pycsar system effector family protein [Leifsonia sp. NPDC080035]|uniref:Pycsar system effector family protein n=1 Tax=Leifsonia sp. NPDC080035 TaxID=3143936 RepID=A0AAU7GCW4_9MICO
MYHAHAEWIARVDTKASILLALQGVGLGVVLTLSGKDGVFASLPHWWDVLAFVAGVLLLLVAIALAVLVIAPRVTAGRPSRRALHDYIYFGHTRWWKPEDLSEALRDSAVPVLSRQLIILGRIAWKKHLYAMFSTWLFLAAAVVLVGLAAVRVLGE